MASFALAQDGPRGSIVEDRAARKLLEAGDSRYDTDEYAKAVEVWQSVIERYPRSRVRFEAHMRLGNYLLERERAYDRARGHFEAVSSEENRDEEQRAEATLKMGRCFYEARNYGKSFKIMRDVIEQFPVSKQVNQAYYYIGLGHFQLGHYSRAIDALEKVGTAFDGEEGKVEKVEAGKRLFIKIEDADLAALDENQTIKVQCVANSGDKEVVDCYSVGRNVRVVLGSVLTRLGKPQHGNGILEIQGGDAVEVTYLDAHRADRSFDVPVLKVVPVVSDAIVEITDGAFEESLGAVVVGREINLQITDADFDVSDKADTIKALVAVYREKTQEEIESETTAAAAKLAESGELTDAELEDQIKIDPFVEIDRVEVELTEEVVERDQLTNPAGLNIGDETEPGAEVPGADAPAAADTPAPADPAAGTEPAEGEEKPETPSAADTATAKDDSIHSGIFRSVVSLVRAEEPIEGDENLQCVPGNYVRILFLDERNSTTAPISCVAQAKCVEGNLTSVRVTRTEIDDQLLLVKTRLKTASALTNIGNRYKEFGLKKNADAKYEQALQVCDEIMGMARSVGGRLLEETYVQLWQIYYEMDQLNLAAAMAQRLQREFPNSSFIDEALLQLADVVRKQGDLRRAITIYQKLVNMQGSQLRGEAQFGVAQCYEEMALAGSTSSAQLYDTAFREYKKVFDQFPDSGRVGEAVAKMANYYYQQKDYSRAIDTFETVLADHPDAQFLDVILFNYGRCLYRLNRRPEARVQFEQLIADFPESPLAGDSKKIAEALARSSE